MKTCKDCQFYERPVPSDAEFWCNKHSVHSRDYRPCKDIGLDPKEIAMNEQALIEKLKKPELAQPFALLSEKEQSIFIQQAKLEGCLFLSDTADWLILRQGNGHFKQHFTYILKPDWEPEPEYLDIAVVNRGGSLQIETKAPSTSIMFIDGVCRDHTFRGWFATSHNEYRVNGTEVVAEAFDKGHKPFARFVKVKK